MAPVTRRRIAVLVLLLAVVTLGHFYSQHLIAHLKNFAKEEDLFSHLLAEDEAHTLPLVNAIASFSLLDPSLKPPPKLPPKSIVHVEIRNEVVFSPSLDEAFRLALPKSETAEAVVTVGAIASFETEWIVEWLTWHRLAGVERFILFDVVVDGDKGGDEGDGKGRSASSLSGLLRPWREEGSVILVEAEWKGGIPDQWHRQLLSMMNQMVIPHTAWYGHWDMDEFLLPPSPTANTTLPPVSRTPLPSLDERNTLAWLYPFHQRLFAVENAVCMPIWRFTFQNVMFEKFNQGPGEWETVTSTHKHHYEVKEAWGAAGGTEWGKVMFHPEYRNDTAHFGGPHNCVPHEGYSTVDPFSGKTYDYLYGGQGQGNLHQGMTLMHFYQRSLSNCYAKIAASGGGTNWRVAAGTEGCDNSFIGTEEKLAASVEGGLVENDVIPAMWETRMTRAILNSWWKGEKWKWLDDGRPKEEHGKRASVIRVKFIL